MRKTTNGMARLTAFAMAAGFVFSQCAGTVMAAGTESVLVGIDSSVQKTAVTDKILESLNPETASDDTASEDEISYEDEASDEEYAGDDYSEDTQEYTDEAEYADSTEAAYYGDPAAVGTVGFAQVDEYLNVRAAGDSESDLVGKIYNNGSLEILDLDENGWYYIRSGNVEGYVASQFVATGSEASDIAEYASYTTATTGAEVLNVRSSASTDADIVAVVTSDDSMEVVDDGGDWIKVVLGDGTYGYVHGDYVDTKTSYSTGETVEEEQARLDAEWTAYLEQQAAAEAAYAAEVAAQAAAYDYSYDTGYDAGYTQDYSYDASADYSYDYSADYGYDYSTDYGYGYSEYDNSYSEYYNDAQAAADAAAQAQLEAQWAAEAAAADAQAAVQYTYDAQSQAEYSYQAYLDAQAAADAAVASGDADLINQTAEAASMAYNAYVNDQAAADAAAQAEADAAWAAQEAANAQAAADEQAASTQQEAENAYTDYQNYEETYSEEQYYQDDVYTEDAQAQETYEEPQQEEASYSSVGADIAAYACQFVGNPYVWGGSSLTNGADCSGFVMSVYANYGISLPHSAAAQAGYGTAVSLDSLQPGDLLFYGSGEIGHVSMYIGNGQVVHASSSTTGIIISDVGYRQAVCARRLV